MEVMFPSIRYSQQFTRSLKLLSYVDIKFSTGICFKNGNYKSVPKLFLIFICMANCISYSTNTIRKGMNPIIILPNIGKQ